MSSSSSRASSPFCPPGPGPDNERTTRTAHTGQEYATPRSSSSTFQSSGGHSSAFQASAGPSSAFQSSSGNSYALHPSAGSSLPALQSSVGTSTSAAQLSTGASLSTFHPSASHGDSPSLLRAPLGFGTAAPSAGAMHGASIPTTAPTQSPPGQGTPVASSSKDRSGTKSRSKDKEKRKSGSSHKGKEKEHGAAQPSAPPSMPVFPAFMFEDQPYRMTAFRVSNYRNEPDAAKPSPTPMRGPYSSDYRAVPSPNLSAAPLPNAQPTFVVAPTGYSQGYPQPSAYPQAQPALDAPPTKQKRSYYRTDYDKQRDNAPARRAKAAAEQSDAGVDGGTAASARASTQASLAAHTPLSQPTSAAAVLSTPAPVAPTPAPVALPTPTPVPLPTPAPVSMSARASVSLPTSAPVSLPTPASLPPPTPAPATPASADSSTPPSTFEHQSYDSPQSYEDNYAAPSPTPLPSEPYQTPESHQPHRSRHHSSRKQHSESHHSPSSLPKHYDPSTSAPSARIQEPSRMLRLLTLLIEDNRDGRSENQLAEVRVELKEEPDGRYFTNAKEVCDDLQAGPSRIDGSAKVYMMRGKYRHYFLRLGSDGEVECGPANLPVSRDRTLEIFVEDNPQSHSTSHSSPNSYRHPSLRAARELLTPITDSMAIPSPVVSPRLMAPLKTTEVFSGGKSTRYIDPHRKRHRSLSTRSTHSDARYIPPQELPPNYHRRSSTPFTHDTSTSPPSPVSSVSPLPQPSYSTPAPAPAPSTYARHAQQTQAQASHLASSATPAPQQEHQGHASFRSTAPYLPGPSPPRKKPRTDHTQLGTAHNVEYPPDGSQTSSMPSATPAQPTPTTPTLSQFNSSFGTLTSQSRLMNSTTSRDNRHLPIPIQLLAQTASATDETVGTYLRSIVVQEPAWTTFAERRNHNLRMSQQLEQYRYMKQTFDRFTGQYTPPDLKGAPSVRITQTQVLRAYNLPASWGDTCKEVLALTALYGPDGKRYEDKRVVDMLDERPAITTKIQTEKFLTLLREIHSRWTIEHPEY